MNPRLTLALLLGVLLGPASGVLDDGALQALTPLTALTVGWAGAAFGAQWPWRRVRRLPRSAWRRAGVQAAAAGAAVAVAAAVFALAAPPLRAAWRPVPPVVLALAAAAVVSGPGAVAWVARAGGAGPRLIRRLTTLAGIETAWGALGMAVAVAAVPPAPAWWGASLLASLPVALAGGALLGLAYRGLAGLLDPDTHTTVLLATLLVGAGAGTAAGVSPFLVCAAAAMAIGHAPATGRRLAPRLEQWQQPLTVLLLVLSGALLGGRALWIVPAALALAAVRVAARWAAARYGGHLAGPPGVPGAAAPAGLAQGREALALGLAAWLVGRGAPGVTAILTTVVVGVVVAQIATPVFIQRARRAAELTASPAPAEVS